jgi:hypothetical protein
MACVARWDVIDDGTVGRDAGGRGVLATLIVWSRWSRGLHLRRTLGNIYRRVLALEEHLAAVTEQHLSRHFRQVEALVGLTRSSGRTEPPRDPGWAASPTSSPGRPMRWRRSRGDRVRERCLHGLAGSCLSLNGSGQIYSLEHPPEFRERTVGELARHGVESWAAV